MSTSEPAVDPRVAKYEALLRQLATGTLGTDDLHDILAGNHFDSTDPVDELGAIIVKAVADISERFEIERSLADVSASIVRGYYFDEVLNHVYDSFRAIIPYDRIGCALLENQRKDVVARWGRHDGNLVKLKVGYSAPLAGSSLERIIDTGEPRIINDLAIYARQNPDSKSTRLILAEGIRSSLTCPLVAMGRPIGFLFFSSELPDSYRSVHTDVFLRLSTVVSVGLEKSILYEELSQLTNDLRAAHQELEFKAHHDGLTGLLNRTAVVRAANDRLSVNRLSSHGGVAVCMLDIDHFKVINDQHGHIVGDRVLQQVADAISASTGADDIVGRYGGEEFLVVADADGPDGALTLGETIRRAVARVGLPGADGHPRGDVSATISAGVSYVPAGVGGEITEVVAEADAALYEAKRSGRNCVRLTQHTPE